MEEETEMANDEFNGNQEFQTQQVKTVKLINCLTALILICSTVKLLNFTNEFLPTHTWDIQKFCWKLKTAEVKAVKTKKILHIKT
jgi:hypothetical protein